jgi:nucleotide-binding universal stress UspA family protein
MSGLTSILVHVDEGAYCPNRLAAAAALAQRHRARLTGIYIVPPLYIPAYTPGDVSPALIDTMEAQRKAAQEKAAAHFAALRRELPDAAWRPIDAEAVGVTSDITPVLASEARGTDLTMVGQIGPGEDPSDAPGAVPEQLVMRAGRPILVIPYAGRFQTIGERAVVAWTDTREAARALADALPLLAQAKTVTVLQVGEGRDQAEPARAKLAGVVEHLQRHGIKADADYLPAGKGATTGNVLLSRVADLSADLLVMGAYGHSRWREIVLGGVTREILSSMTAPVLMSH